MKKMLVAKKALWIFSWTACGVSVLGMGPKPATTWNFDSDTVGEAARGFSLVSGEWKVVADETAPSKGKVLAQLAKNDESTFNVVLLDEPIGTNVDLKFKFRTVSGKIDQGGGAVFRAKDGKNYYLCRYNPLEANIRLYKVVDGVRTIIHSVEEVNEVSGWQSMRVVTNGKRIEGHVNGEVRFSITDESFPDAGKIGLWTKADAVTHFDDLELEIMGR